MIEIPEAMNLSKQINTTLKDKTILKVTAAHSKHKFVWYYGKPQGYQKLMQNQTIDYAHSFGGFVEIAADDKNILFSEGANLRYFEDHSRIPQKHQLLIEFTDKSYLCASVQMYGGVGCFPANEIDNKYYWIAKEKPSPLSKEFDMEYFFSLLEANKEKNLSLKAFLATEQRIPGLGNGVLQDILYNARLHPRQKIDLLSEVQISSLLKSIQTTLEDMTIHHGRDTEKDLFGINGKYITKVSKNTVGQPCAVCGSSIVKSSYMGGSIYFCPGCQKI